MGYFDPISALILTRTNPKVFWLSYEKLIWGRCREILRYTRCTTSSYTKPMKMLELRAFSANRIKIKTCELRCTIIANSSTPSIPVICCCPFSYWGVSVSCCPFYFKNELDEQFGSFTLPLPPSFVFVPKPKDNN